MAGIGFELKKLFSRKGMLATMRAYGYAGIVCTGPMILGVVLLLGVTFIAEISGLARNDRELLVSMITYALLASLTLTSIFSMLTTRSIADCIYVEDDDKIMPSFYGSLSIMLVVGFLGYGTFLIFSGIPISYQILTLILFLTLLVVWTEINYLTAIKDYKNIIVAFAVSLTCAFLISALFIFIFKWDIIISLLCGVCCGYGIMMIWYFILLYKYFPEGFGTGFNFLKWFDKFPQLSLIGFFTTLGLFGHLVIMWASSLGVQVRGLYYGAPEYDVSALVAFFSILITTINFVTSVETRFYPTYKTYFGLFNDGGAIEDIENAEINMIRVLKEELSYLAQKQVFTTIIFVVVGTLLLPNVGLGFTSEMLGIFRILCVGYAFYAIGNSIMLILLYFSDNKGALVITTIFAVATNLFTILLMNGRSIFYGYGFVIGSCLFCVCGIIRLINYLNKLKYHVLSKQPIFYIEKHGILSKLAFKLDKRAVEKQQSRYEYYSKHLVEKLKDENK